MNGLRAGPDAGKPFNYTRSLILLGVVAFVMAFVIQFLVGKQTRRQMDEEMNERSRIVGNGCP
jgi:MFS transporter, FLVCR family, MFS-domain-containing protein 7